MKVTLDVSMELAERIQSMPDPGKAVEEALWLKEHEDWRRGRLTPQAQAILQSAARKAETFQGTSRDELFDRIEAVADRIHLKLVGT